MAIQRPFNFKNRIVGNLQVRVVLFLFVSLIVTATQGQIKRKKTVKKTIKAELCKIGTTNFKCPDDFLKEQTVDENTILFKQNYEGSIIYFFVAIPEKEFNDIQVKNIIAAKFSGNQSDIFRWKDVKQPLVMDLETKYEKKIMNQLGYNNKLINFVSRYFEFNGKTIVIGYGYDADSDGMMSIFEKGNAIGDSAIGCNAIATTLNSMTKEKKGNLQYCTLSAFTASE